ncbi:hypothetical protein SEPCBS57363_004319 [Sporothrix epigloea]|uniref:Zn(2)-C6 fungal-type domain-containing protein n=1 Tax=Sporothrix epigloea TaxID=1892477 RepID=A0ABP0DRL5_9PEZI
MDDRHQDLERPNQNQRTEQNEQNDQADHMDTTDAQPPAHQRIVPTPPQGARNLVFDAANWHPKPVKRPRPVKSCTECRRRKLRCDRRFPCSQCQRSYRVCKYGSGGDSSLDFVGKSTDRHNNNNNAESEGSEGSEDDGDTTMGTGTGKRPSKRQLSRLSTGPMVHQQNHNAAAASSSHPPSNSSLNLLLNPPSPPQQQTSRQAHNPTQHQHQHLHPYSAHQPYSPPIPAASMQNSFPSLAQVSKALDAPEPLVPSDGDDLRKLAVSLLMQCMVRMECLESLVATRDPAALADMPAFPSSSVLSQLHIRQQPPHEANQRIIEVLSTTMRSLNVKGRNGLRTRFFGQSSTRVLVNLFDDAKYFMSQKAKQQNYGDMFWRLERIHNALQESHLQSLKPIAVYVDSIMPVQKRMVDILPRRETCEQLVQSYVSVSEGLYRVIHVPTFMQEFNAYWAYGVTGNAGGGSTRTGGPTVGGGAAGAEGGESRGVQGAMEDFLPRLLCILCIGSRFETESKGLTYEWSDGVHIPTACALVRSWLDGLRGKPSIDLNTLQTEVLLLHASRMILPPQRIWTELGMISRPAMAMGLHRDPSEFGADVTPFQAECRRKLWFTIMDMDLHVSLACGLPSSVRPGQFTCRPPRNLDDTDLYPEMTMLPPGKPIDHHTEGQMQLFAADTLPLRMRASELLCNVDSLTNYWEVLDVGGDLEKALDDINCLFPRNAVLTSDQAHREWRTRAMLDMHVRRPLLSLYRPFALSVSAEYPPPAAVSDVYLKSSMAMLTYMDELDSSAPSYDHVSHMYYVMLRNDIVQAAFSVCYYIIQAVEIETSLTDGVGSSSTNAGRQGEGSATPPAHAHGAPPPSAMSGSSGSWGAGRYSGSGSAGGSSFGTGGGRHNTPHPSAARKRSVPIWSSTYMIRTVKRTLDSLARLVNDLSFDLRDVVALAVVLGSVMPASSPAERSEQIHLQVRGVLDTCTKQLCNHSSTAIRAAVLGQVTSPMSYHGAGGYGGWSSTPDEAALWDLSFWDLWTPTGT